ncbi:unnamed protein product, partial [Ectocarpus sp. 12 AP-2014]
HFNTFRDTRLLHPLLLQPPYKSTHIQVGTDVHNCIPRLWLARSCPGEHVRPMLANTF